MASEAAMEVGRRRGTVFKERRSSVGRKGDEEDIEA